MNNDAPILRLPELLEAVRLCKGSVYRGMAEGTFPKNVKLTRRAVGWKRSDVERWVADPANYRAEVA
jgi:prophage regulatory protein